MKADRMDENKNKKNENKGSYMGVGMAIGSLIKKK